MAASLAAVLLEAAFFDVGVAAFSFAALTAAQRFRAAAAMVLLPALLILRFGPGDTVTGVDDLDLSLLLAHRRCWAALILRRVSAENFRRLEAAPSGVAADFAGPLVGSLRSSAICWPIQVSCKS